MEILRKIAFYALVILLPLELICVIISIIKKEKLDELLRLTRLLFTVWILAGLYFGSMIL